MDIRICTERDQEMIGKLMHIWRDSVSATHTFLTSADIDRIAAYVPDALKSIPVLLLAEEQGEVVGFAGIDNEQLEMLFLSPDFRNRGIGKAMVRFMIRDFSVTEVCVNEQNPGVRGFYEHMGFEVYQRDELDGQGNPFPILHMRRRA